MQPYRAMLANHGVTQSMSRKGNCFDNAVIESFFGTLKPSISILQRSTALRRSKRACTITLTSNNHERIKLGLRGLSPLDYRLRSTA